jgi:hypothetical protein
VNTNISAASIFIVEDEGLQIPQKFGNHRLNYAASRRQGSEDRYIDTAMRSSDLLWNFDQSFVSTCLWSVDGIHIGDRSESCGSYVAYPGPEVWVEFHQSSELMDGCIQGLNLVRANRIVSRNLSSRCKFHDCTRTRAFAHTRECTYKAQKCTSLRHTLLTPCKAFFLHFLVGWGTMLQAVRSRVRFPVRSLDFPIDLILPAALWRRSRLSF